MSDTPVERTGKERRKFPRIYAQCAVNYFTRSNGNWCEAELYNYSAGGICFRCQETLLQDTKITIKILKNAHKTVPAVAASAVVVRCEVDEDHQYKVACRFTEVRQENVNKLSRFYMLATD